MAKEKIGIFGSADQVDPRISIVTQQLGEVLARHNPILVNGACSGIPYDVAYAARQAGLDELWGFSAATNFDAQVGLTPGDDNSIYTRLIYVPDDIPLLTDLNVARKYRNVTSTATCDAGLIVAGRIGTLNEFTNLFDMGKVIGVMAETGGIADQLPQLMAQINKASNATIIFDNHPGLLVGRVMEEIRKRQTNGN